MSIRTGVVCLFAFSVLAVAQMAAARQEGKLISDSSPDHLWVELYEGSGHTLVDRAPVNRDGTFTVSAAPAHFYELRVVTRHGERVASDHVQFRTGQPVEVRLPKSLTAGPRPAGPISVLRLAHKPGKDAKKFARTADSLAADGKLPDSVVQLERALSADPQWFEAWKNLGSRRLQMGNYAGAAEAFRRALEIDSNSGMVQSNLGLALLFLRDAAGAEESARRALLLEPESGKASYVAGLALLQQNKRTEEGLAALRAAAKEVPRALLATAEWHCRHDEFRECVADLRTFLKTPRGPNHEVAERWLGVLKKEGHL